MHLIPRHLFDLVHISLAVETDLSSASVECEQFLLVPFVFEIQLVLKITSHNFQK
jgi:hypothetical protein